MTLIPRSQAQLWSQTMRRLSRFVSPCAHGVRLRLGWTMTVLGFTWSRRVRPDILEVVIEVI
jgi:hypothetical protein